MAREALVWKIYSERDRYVAATKFTTEAAMLVAALGDGASVKYQHHTLAWAEGKEGFSAADSYDDAGEMMIARVNASRLDARETYEREQAVIRARHGGEPPT